MLVLALLSTSVYAIGAGEVSASSGTNKCDVTQFPIADLTGGDAPWAYGCIDATHARSCTKENGTVYNPNFVIPQGQLYHLCQQQFPTASSPTATSSTSTITSTVISNPQRLQEIDVVWAGFMGQAWSGIGRYVNPTNANSVWETLTNSWKSFTVTYPNYQYHSEKMSVLGEPSLTEERIKVILVNAVSPAKDSYATFYREGVRSRIDPAFALAFFKHESNYGKAGVAEKTNSISNRRVPGSCAYNASACFEERASLGSSLGCQVDCDTGACDFVYCNKRYDSCTGEGNNCYSCYCGYNDWDKSIPQWFDLIKGPTYVGAGKTTVDDIIPTYSPASDNEGGGSKGEQSVRDYIEDVKNTVIRYRRGDLERQ